MPRYQQPFATLSLDQQGNLLVRVGADWNTLEKYLAAFKALVPNHDRSYDKPSKTWTVAYRWGHDIAGLCETYIGVRPAVPRQIILGGDNKPQTKLLTIHYIGAAKERDDGSVTSSAADEAGQWIAIFPVEILRSWFGANPTAQPDEVLSHYAILGVKSNSDLSTIKKAHRLAAKTWHPDLNKDADAAEQFRLIQRAYEVLADDTMRRKYDLGLLWAKQAESKKPKSDGGYRGHSPLYMPPVRCGIILCEGVQTVRGFQVSRIKAWKEIINQSGQTMISYWTKDAKSFERQWI